MLMGAIAGDIIGSSYEHAPTKNKYFELFRPDSRPTDDTFALAAVAAWLLDGGDLGDLLKRTVRDNPGVGWGRMMFRWAQSPTSGSYGSWGNGGAMRVAPAAWISDALDECLERAEATASVTHSHPEGVRAAQAVAAAIWMARQGWSRDAIAEEITLRFGYDLSLSIYELRPTVRFDSSAQSTVPRALIAFLESTDYEDAVRNAVSLGGDADTDACIAGAIAHAFYRAIPSEIGSRARRLLPQHLLAVVDRFEAHCQSI